LGLLRSVYVLRISQPAEMGTPLTVRVGSTVADVEQQLIMATLDACGGNKQKAAELLGVSLKTIYNRLNAYREHRAA
jgi:DNA-binding NtrC family response regulator